MSKRKLETGTGVKREKVDRPLPHPIQRKRLTGENSSKDQVAEVRVLGDERADAFAGTKNVKTRHVVTGILPCDRITSVKQDAGMAKIAITDMLRQSKSPAQKSKKGSAKGQVAMSNWVVCLKIPSRENLFYG